MIYYIIHVYVCIYIYIHTHVYIYIYIHIIFTLDWQDAVRGARWGLEYLDLLRDIRVSELISQSYATRENVKICSG